MVTPGPTIDPEILVPVPTVVAKDDIRVVENSLIDRLDAYSAPRLTEYFDPDPCPSERGIVMGAIAPSVPPLMSAPAGMALSASLGVTIEAPARTPAAQATQKTGNP